jgi:hypothetical protein
MGIWHNEYVFLSNSDKLSQNKDASQVVFCQMPILWESMKMVLGVIYYVQEHQTLSEAQSPFLNVLDESFVTPKTLDALRGPITVFDVHGREFCYAQEG